MIGDSIFKKIIYSSWFLAAIPAVVIMLFLPPIGNKYSLKIDRAGRNSGTHLYADLNSDSISERILTGKGGPYYFISVQNNEHLFFDQWNMSDSLTPSISKIFFGNFDHDRFDEIYVFSYSQDSLFLNMNEILQPSGTRMERIFITRIGYLHGILAASLWPAGFYDEDGDGKDELYFSISSYFRLGPRKLFYFNMVNKEVKSSQFSGTIILNPKMEDADDDKKPEIFGTLSASGNYSADTPYSDSSTWLMVLNDKLNLKFTPTEFPGFANGLETLPYQSDQFRGYIVSHQANGADSNVLKSRIMIFSSDGKLIRYRLYRELGIPGRVGLFTVKSVPSDRIYLFSDKFVELNDRLEFVREEKLPFDSEMSFFRYDLDGDRKDEFMLYSEDQKKLIVYSEDFKKLTEVLFFPPDVGWSFSGYLYGNHEYKVFLSSGNEGYFLKLSKNNYFMLGYLAYPAIYMFFILFILVIKRINTYQLKVKDSLNQRLITLQLQGIKAQLDPHFTFNTLNSVASLIYLEDRQAAYDHMRKFTQLLRSMLNDAERIYRNLGEEIDFVTTYLELEKLRFGEKFNYEIKIGDGISREEKVPKLVLQTFAENAVKHGIVPTGEGGTIKISVAREKDYLKLTIEDNGIGRERSAGHSTSTGKGLKLTTEFYEILNQINKKPIKHLITDLYNNSLSPAGTRVEVWVPVEEFPAQFKN
jgi:two-component sensor histidine kinase